MAELVMVVCKNLKFGKRIMEKARLWSFSELGSYLGPADF